MATQTDARGKVVTTETDPDKGIVTKVTDPKGQEVISQYFNDYMNNPKLYQIEDPVINRSHIFEMR